MIYYGEEFFLLFNYMAVFPLQRITCLIILTSQCKSDICMDVSREGDSLGAEILFLAQ